MSKRRSKKSFLSTLMWVLVLSLILTACLRPAMKMIYPLRYREAIEKYSEQFDLNEYLVMGIISTESNFNTHAHSSKHAKGLMQIKEETALWCIEHLKLDADTQNIYTPDENIYIGCAYLSYLEKLYGGDTRKAVMAYNAGLGNVNKWLSDPRYADASGNLNKIPFRETEMYVKKVMKRMEIYMRLYG